MGSSANSPGERVPRPAAPQSLTAAGPGHLRARAAGTDAVEVGGTGALPSDRTDTLHAGLRGESRHAPHSSQCPVGKGTKAALLAPEPGTQREPQAGSGRLWAKLPPPHGRSQGWRSALWLQPHPSPYTLTKTCAPEVPPCPLLQGSQGLQAHRPLGWTPLKGNTGHPLCPWARCKGGHSASAEPSCPHTGAMCRPSWAECQGQGAGCWQGTGQLREGSQWHQRHTLTGDEEGGASPAWVGPRAGLWPPARAA